VKLKPHKNLKQTQTLKTYIGVDVGL